MTELIQSLTEALPNSTFILVLSTSTPGVPASAIPEPVVLAGSDAEMVARAKQAADDSPLTLTQWGRELPDISTRELLRAHKEGGLDSQIRESGLGHGAIEATPDAVLKYLQTCAAVQQGTMAAPTWWSKVRKGSNGRRNHG